MSSRSLRFSASRISPLVYSYSRVSFYHTSSYYSADGRKGDKTPPQRSQSRTTPSPPLPKVEQPLSAKQQKSKAKLIDPSVLSGPKNEKMLKEAKQKTQAFIPADKAQRFSRDLFLNAVQHEGALEAVLNDLKVLQKKVKEDKEFNQMFRNPLTPANVRRAALRDYLQNTKLHPLSANALQVLGNIRALPLIGNVVAALQSMYDLLHKRLDVIVTMASDNEQERQRVAEQLKKQIGDQASLSFVWKTDPSLISGMKAEVRGNLLFDTTGRKKLEDEASGYMARLDNELSRLKQEKIVKTTGPLDPEQQIKYMWDKLLSDVQRHDLASPKQEKGSQVAGQTGRVQSDEGADTERMRLLTEIYNFKRVSETKTKG